MLNLESFIAKEGNLFYFDLEEYNQKSDISLEEGDVVKFTYEKEKYMGKVTSVGSKKNQAFILEITKKA
jgi:hypothetical protein